MKWRSLAALGVFAAGAPACRLANAPPVTGIAGSVLRGPVTPVCMVDVPCDAPFAASFEVRRGGRLVTTFRSDSIGHLVVALYPATYVIVPAADAPIMDPASQAKTVEVGSEGYTLVQLVFDTGIR